MSVKIRKGMFETNSSSAHVLAIRKKILEDRDYPIADEIRSHIDKNIYDLLVEVLFKNGITAKKFVDDGHYIMIIDKVGMPTWTAIWNSPISNHNCERYYLINGKLEVHDGNEI